MEVAVEQRYLNKANGAENCPYIKHIVRDLPYIAIGPNDVKTDIHSPNESIPTVRTTLRPPPHVCLSDQ